MTNKEAISVLQTWRVTGDTNHEALNKAIGALMSQAPRPVESDIDHTWGIHKKVPVCPMCESYLTVTHFFGDGKKITYCESCGQAIDWGKWEYDE